MHPTDPSAHGRRHRAAAPERIATYGSKGDVYRFYDINPAVIAIANRDFTYLPRTATATIEHRRWATRRLQPEREAPHGFSNT